MMKQGNIFIPGPSYRQCNYSPRDMVDFDSGTFMQMYLFRTYTQPIRRRLRNYGPK